MEDTIKVIIKPEHFRDAPHGYSHFSYADGTTSPCVLECALIEIFGKDKIGHVGFDTVDIDGCGYNISEDWGHIQMSPHFTPDRIDEYSEKAKVSLEGIPTTEVILTKISADSDN